MGIKLRNRSADQTPGPGSYKVESSIGHQSQSIRKSANAYTFGTSQRATPVVIIPRPSTASRRRSQSPRRVTRPRSAMPATRRPATGGSFKQDPSPFLGASRVDDGPPDPQVTQWVMQHRDAVASSNTVVATTSYDTTTRQVTVQRPASRSNHSRQSYSRRTRRVVVTRGRSPSKANGVRSARRTSPRRATRPTTTKRQTRQRGRSTKVKKSRYVRRSVRNSPYASSARPGGQSSAYPTRPTQPSRTKRRGGATVPESQPLPQQDGEFEIDLEV